MPYIKSPPEQNDKDKWMHNIFSKYSEQEIINALSVLKYNSLDDCYDDGMYFILDDILDGFV